MKYVLTGQQMRQADRYTIEEIGIPSMVLMERAALKVVETIESENVNLSKVLVVCGTGNNGGDGFAIARLLHLKGHQVCMYLIGEDERRSEENKKQKQIVEYYKIPILDKIEENDYTLIIDAIFGVGLNKNISGEYRTLIETLNQMDGFKVAVDIPSGINDITGEIKGVAFVADMTVALAYLKRGHMICANHPNVGKLFVVDIGISIDSLAFKNPITYCYDDADFFENFPKRKADSHKGTYGKALLIVGSNGMAGAAYLCAKACYFSGCGLVRIYTHRDNLEILQSSLPEAIVTTYDEYNSKQLEELLEWADVVGIGSGLGTSETSRLITKQVLKYQEISCVIDADALNMIADEMEVLKETEQVRVLTPHIKEMSRLLKCSVEELKTNKFQYLQEFCETYQLCCVMKDARSLVYQPGEDFFLNTTGNSAMAKGGSGDVLTGTIVGIMAQSKEAYKSACLGVYLNGLAGDIAADKKGYYSVLASDIIDGIGEVLKQI